MINDTFANGDDDNSLSISRFPRQIRYWSYLISNIFSLICTLLTLYFLLFDRTLRNSLNNHIIIILLLIGLLYELIDIPLIINNDANDIPWSSSPTFYLFWVFFDYTFYSLQIGLFAWATIERHILIFHDRWLSTRNKRLFLHYFPIGGLIIYYLIYYSIVHFVPNCSNSFDSFLHGGIFIPCSFDRTFLGLWDLIVHQFIPTLIIIIFSISLLIRILIQKRRLNQQIQWRKCRKMTIQLLSISIIYLIFNTPWVFLIFAYQFGLPDNIAIPALMYTGYLFYYVIFLFPLVSLLSLSELRSKIKSKIFCFKRQQRINPTSTAGTRLRIIPT